MARINRVSGELDPLQRQIALLEPSQPVLARFIIGCDRMGRWIVNDRQGKVGGMFASEQAALRFARDESGRNQTLVSRAPQGQILELGLPSGLRVHLH